MKTVPISLLIPTMNRPQALYRTLRSFFAAEAVPCEVIVVDQSGEPQTIAENRGVAESFADRAMVQYFHREKPSLTAARNFAASMATQPILLCCDDDVDAEKDTLLHLEELFRDETVALVAGTDLAQRGTQSVLGYLAGTRSFSKRREGHVTASLLGRYPDSVQGNVKTAWAMGYFFALRRELVTKWGLSWDENLESYGYAEDLDFSMQYCRLAEREGLQCLLSDRVCVTHLATVEYRIPSRKSTMMYVINRAYLCEKHRLGLKCRIAMAWTNFCRLAERFFRREAPGDLRDALRAARSHRREIAAGKLAELYR